MAYDDDNVFAKILRGEIPADKVYEDEHVLAFNDIAHLAPVHILVIPKGKYVSCDDFTANASDAEMAALMRAVGTVARDRGVVETGYRMVSNSGPDAGQEVPHFHIHVFGGRRLGGLKRQASGDQG
jgi:diadenosine tetraphosphate (Ap4A) HIT family hydrolase